MTKLGILRTMPQLPVWKAAAEDGNSQEAFCITMSAFRLPVLVFAFQLSAFKLLMVWLFSLSGGHYSHIIQAKWWALIPDQSLQFSLRPTKSAPFRVSFKANHIRSQSLRTNNRENSLTFLAPRFSPDSSWGSSSVRAMGIRLDSPANYELFTFFNEDPPRIQYKN